MRKVCARSNFRCKWGKECKLPARRLFTEVSESSRFQLILVGAPRKGMLAQGPSSRKGMLAQVGLYLASP
jgi:hypothetical protein